jgi:hypothetical protein
MSKRIHLAIAAVGLALSACAQPKEDPKVAELQKELAAVKQDLAATKDAQAGPATEKTLADQQSALSEQKTASDRAAAENARLRSELEDMKPRQFTLPAGTVIPVRTTAEISTSKVKNGSVFDALLEKDLVSDGTTLAKAGALVNCIVVESDPGGRVKGVASLSVAARSIAGAGSNPIPIKTESYMVDAESTKGRDAKRTGIATAIGAGIGAIAGGGSGAAIGAGAGAAAGVGANMATRGKAAVIPTETLIEFALSAPATVVLRK